MIVFGLNTKTGTYHDSLWAEAVLANMQGGNNFAQACEYASTHFLASEQTFYFLNPMVVQYLDDSCADKIYYIDYSTGCVLKFTDNPKLVWKLRCMGLGEALMDSVEVCPE